MWFKKFSFLILLSLYKVEFGHAATRAYEITGNLTYWDSVFASRTPSIVLSSFDVDVDSHILSWTEGPVLTWFEDHDGDLEQQQQHHVIFSDTIQAKIFDLNLESKEVMILLENSGDAPLEEISWRAEPGSNGLAFVPVSTSASVAHSISSDHRWLVVCQHGARRMALLDRKTGAMIPLVTHAPNGRRLNGPNDVIVKKEIDGTYIYFTDPVYAWLEKERFEDLPYLDDRVKDEGPGYCGVYRSRIDADVVMNAKENVNGNVHVIVNEKDYAENQNANNKTIDQPSNTGIVELIATMDRPNGIGFLKSSDVLVVSDCCQGTHKKSCQQGTSRWIFYEPRLGSTSDDLDGRQSSHSWDRIRVIEDRQSTGPPESTNERDVSDQQGYGHGCADGFETILNSSGEDVLIASCADGLCLVDVQRGEVVARLWTTGTGADGGGCRISNVAVATDRVFLTGNCGILQLFLRKERRRQEHTDNSRGSDVDSAEL